MRPNNIIGCYLYLLYNDIDSECVKCGEHFELSELNDQNVCNGCTDRFNERPQEEED